ncbi:hypothetical protein O0235_04830 [Tepidiforma flava]|uniref:Uncharacterized protein n=1 Tax=Tepidiforma flava TaxID=3004094 RepID=A0ABY7MBM8_9CHLR|nr:hypothetical protein [Tepidiforma flava]WBL36888.1 hypothetical protein O0235_04830 [Tepidiforma flava]
MLLAQALVPLAVVLALAAALVSRAAARDTAAPPPAPRGARLFELAAILLLAGVIGTAALALFIGGYAGSLERAAWAGGSFLAGFAAAAIAALLAVALDADDGRPAAAGPLAGAALPFGAAAGAFALAAGPAGEGPWTAASLAVPAAAGAGLAALIAAAAGPREPARAAGAAWAAAAAPAAALAGLLAGGEAAALARDAARAAYPLAVLACALAGAAVAVIPGTVMAAAGRRAAGLAAAWVAAPVTALAALGAAVVLLPGGEGWAAGAAAAGALAGLALAHPGAVPRAPSAAAFLPWLFAAAGAAAAWLLGRELTDEGFGAPAAGCYGLALAAAAALGPVIARASLVPLVPAAAASSAEEVSITLWARPGEGAGLALESRPAAPPPAPSPAGAAFGGAILAAAALALAVGAHGRHELLRTAAADPVAYAETVQALGLVPPGAPDRYALANEVRAHRETLDELRAAVGDDADFGPADIRLLLVADAASRDAFVATRLAAGDLIEGEAAAIRAARWPLPSLLPLPAASAGGVLGILLGFAAVAGSGLLLERRPRPWLVFAAALAVPAVLLAAAPALRFLGPGPADAFALLAAFALAAGPGAGLLAARAADLRAAALGPAFAALALALAAGALVST